MRQGSHLTEVLKQQQVTRNDTANFFSEQATMVVTPQTKNDAAHKRITSTVNPKSSTPGVTRKRDGTEKSKADLQAEFLALER